MKKFLTVLLALSVVFTYSFSAVGTAFAAMPADPGAHTYTEAEVLKKIDDAYKAALEKAKDEKNEALKTIFGTDDKGNLEKEKDIYGSDITADDANKLTVTLSAVETVYKTTYDVAVEKINDNYNKQMSAFREAIAAVNENAAKDSTDEAKKYNGYFFVQVPGTEDSEWMKEGYAKFDAAWEKTATYEDDVNTTKTTYVALFTATNGSGNTSLDSDKVYAAGSHVKDVADAVFEEAQDDAVAAARAVKLDEYSKEYNGQTESNYDKALKDVTNAIKALQYITNAEGSTATDAEYWTGAVTAVGKVAEIYTAPVNNGNPGGYLYTGTPQGTQLPVTGILSVDLIGLNNITKNADLPTEASKLAWAQNLVIDTVVKAINDDLSGAKKTFNNIIVEETLKGDKANATVIENAKKDIADAEEAAAAQIEILKYLVMDCDEYNDLVTVTAHFTSSTVDTNKWAYDANNDELTANGKTYDKKTAIKVVVKVADLKDDAELAKKYIGIDNTTLEDIEAALDAAIRDAYNKDLDAVLDVGDALETLYKYQEKLIDGTDIKINDRAYGNVNSWGENLAAVYAKEKYADVRKVVADTKDAIRATASIADAQAAFLKGFAELDAIPTLADRMAAQITKEFKELRDLYAKDIAKYADYKEGVIKDTDYSWKKSIMVANLIATLDEAYTVDELKDAYAKARAEIDGLKKKAVIIDEQKSLLDKIKALPTTITVADKAVVGELKDAVADHNDYCDLIGDATNKVSGATNTALDKAYDTIKALEGKAIKKQYDDIMKDGKVTVDEADAVKALRTAFDEFVAYYSDPEGEHLTYPANVSEKNVSDAEESLDVALVKAFFNMVAQLPADGSDVAGIKAARAAYEALSRDAKYGVGAYHSDYYSKLVDLEKLIIKNVESLKIKVTTKRYTGSKMRVNWTAAGDTSGIDGYRIYFSTKKTNSGYKYLAKTSKKYINHTSIKKNVKKGTRVFYRVRAYVEIDGQRYFSDYSTVGNRIWK